MPADGVYSFLYTGNVGLGVGVFRIDGGQVRGCDYAGGRYWGTATDEPDGKVTLAISFEVSPGIELVHGTAAQDRAYIKNFSHTFPPAFGDGEPQCLEIPPGQIIAMIKRVSDELAVYADGFQIVAVKR